MEGRKGTSSRPAAKSKSPAERAAEFSATQRRLKEEATARREAAAQRGDTRKS
ncbi:MAG TPA: hypothetical protein VGW75_01715 [Solirubrobacteraceae bacterium]|jgi:hypothetical protein|nr:hypothetical protein [Solirubrobacteraceae bacterium]